jgi:hypothetical protein
MTARQRWSISESAKTTPMERFDPVDVYTSFLGEKRP